MMTDTLKMNTYFRPGITSLDRLQRERDSFAAMSRRRAAYDARVLREYDERIAELQAAEEPDIGSLCDCGNGETLPGYRVCAECKAAREQYPRLFVEDAPDEAQEANDAS